jgi:hypothetical protein
VIAHNVKLCTNGAARAERMLTTNSCNNWNDSNEVAWHEFFDCVGSSKAAHLAMQGMPFMLFKKMYDMNQLPEIREEYHSLLPLEHALYVKRKQPSLPLPRLHHAVYCSNAAAIRCYLRVAVCTPSIIRGWNDSTIVRLILVCTDADIDRLYWPASYPRVSFKRPRE